MNGKKENYLKSQRLLQLGEAAELTTGASSFEGWKRKPELLPLGL